MKQVNLYEAKTNLSALVDAAAAGEEIVIAKNGKPRARLSPMERPPAPTPQRFGFWGKYGYRAPDDFPETTPEEIGAWEDGKVFPRDE
jgi:prevent-host-death family protein